MSESIVLSVLRTKVRERADMVNSLFCTDTEINGYIDLSYADYYDLLAECGVDYYATSALATITTGNTMPLPSDFLHLRGIDDITDTNNPLTVRKFNFAERNTMDDYSILHLNDQYSPVYYRVYGANIEIRPITLAPRPYKLWYIPRRTPLTTDADTIDAVNGWHEMIINDAAIKCLLKEESDTRALQSANAAIKEKILRSANDRDSAQPEKIARVRNRLQGRISDSRLPPSF